MNTGMTGGPGSTYALDSFSAGCAAVYAAHDERRSLWDIWLHTHHHAAALAEQIRKRDRHGRLLPEVADFAVWLFTFQNRLRQHAAASGRRAASDVAHVVQSVRTYDDVLWQRYPGVCPICVELGHLATGSAVDLPVPCKCVEFDFGDASESEARSRASKLRAFSTQRSLERPTCVDGWQQLLGGVYGAQTRKAPLLAIALHLLEELGELADAMIRLYSFTGEGPPTTEELSWRQRRLEDELADVSTTLLVLVEALGHWIKVGNRWLAWTTDKAEAEAGILLSGVVARRYWKEGEGTFICRHCREATCSCEVLLSPSGLGVDELLKIMGPA